MTEWIEKINAMVWGAPTLVLILGVGILLTVQTGFIQIRLLPRALMQFFAKLRQEPEKEGVSPFQALCTALAATVGTGNLVGVAGAIALGGPGSIFWMWICALLGMVIKFAEATLAVRFRIFEKGEYLAGPMYMIRNGLGKYWNWLATVYAFFGIIAALGVGNAVQLNAVISGINEVIRSFGGSRTGKGDVLMALILSALVGLMIIGGAKRIGKTAEVLMPFVSVCYILLCCGVVILRWEAVPGAVAAIVKGAFSPDAVTGGTVGSVFLVLKVGVSRGIFTNEAGMGTASIAHGAAEVCHPAEQGLMGIVEVFLDTIVICTLTALVILCSGVPIPYGQDAGGTLTGAAFSAVYGGWVAVFLAAALCCFAFGTVLGWGLYGARCAQFLFGNSGWKWFALAQTAVAFLGALLNSSTVWILAETVNGLMAIPNLVAVFLLRRKLKELIRDYHPRRETLRKGWAFSRNPLTKMHAKW